MIPLRDELSPFRTVQTFARFDLAAKPFDIADLVETMASLTA